MLHSDSKSKIKNGRVVADSSGSTIVTCKSCQGQFGKDTARVKLKKFRDNSGYFNVKACPYCDSRIYIRDENPLLTSLKKRLVILERYATQCKYLGEFNDFRETMGEIEDLKRQIEEVEKKSKFTAHDANNEMIQFVQSNLEDAIDHSNIDEIKRWTGELIKLLTKDSKKVLKQTTKDQESHKIIQIEFNDPDGQLRKFLTLLRDMANPGHSFNVVLDPDSDYSQKVFFDGDGSFRISHIKEKEAGDADFTIDNIGRHNDIEDSEFDTSELSRGIKVEMEHTDSLDVAKAIAKDHLCEIPDYYTHLKKMESEVRKVK